MSPIATAAFLAQAGHLVDIAKIGWGVGYVDPTLAERVALYRAAGIEVSLGGTLLEVSAAQGRVDDLRDWALSCGISVLEVSDGLARLDRQTKTDLIRGLSKYFSVAAEVGAKDAGIPVVDSEWLADMEADLDAGARWLVTEGRESGTVGIYSGDGTVRDDLISAIADRLPLDRVIFEAPNKAQQTWFIRTIGHEVNLGNISPEEVIPLETLRLGLRADTALRVPGYRVPDASADACDASNIETVKP
jgi:phosphosulfolactate synthase